jgi:hypothetical protein
MINPLKRVVIVAGVFLIAACHNDKPKTATTTTNAADSVAPDRPSPKPAIDSNAKDGMNTVYYKSGVIRAKGNCYRQKKDGEWQSFYESGKLWSDEFFNGGLQDGKVTVYYESGQKMYEGQFKMGNPYGIWNYWNQKGELTRTTNYNKKQPNSSF